MAFLKNRLGTSRRLQTYVGQLAAVALADLTKMQVLEWFHAIGQAKGGHAANQALQQLHSMYVKADDWELFTRENPAHRIKKFPKHCAGALSSIQRNALGAQVAGRRAAHR